MKEIDKFPLSAQAFSVAVTTVANRLVEAGDAVLVVDQAKRPGGPTLMVLVPAMVPVFVWVTPSRFAVEKEWEGMRRDHERTFERFGVAFRAIENEQDLDELCNMLADAQPPADESAAENQVQATDEQPDAQAVEKIPVPDMSFLD